MLAKLLSAAAIAAAQISSASAFQLNTHCGWENEACCPGNECLASRTACWEGTCMPCGKDGKPVCPTGPKCDEGTKEKDYFCVHDNGPLPPPPPPPSAHCGWRNEQCCADNVCLADRTECWEGTCMDCGQNGKPKCNTAPPCDEGNVVNQEGWCSTYNPPHAVPPPPPTPSAHCGWRNEQCCADNKCLVSRTACWEGTCMDCGKDGKPVCPSSIRCDAGTKEKDGFCVHDNGHRRLL